MSLDQRVRPDTFVYGEVQRLYRIARSLRPTPIDRWNGELYATTADTLGGIHATTGALRLSAHRVLPYLTGSVSANSADQQAEALATVLHEATHGGMTVDAPDEPNAVRTEHSYGLIEGLAEVRTFTDFPLFTKRAGYPGLALDKPQYPGAFVATRDLMAHVTGPAYTRDALINDSCGGPGVMHFDQFAHAVVTNRLGDLVQGSEADQRALRRELVEPMLHAHWPTLPKTSAGTGQSVAREIRSALDAKVDELRQTYRISGPAPLDAQQPWRELNLPPSDPQTAVSMSGTRPIEIDSLRFLTANASPTGAVTRRPNLGQGARGSSPGRGPQTRPGQSVDRPRD